MENMPGMRRRKKSGKHARNAQEQKKWKTCQECVGAKKVENMPVSSCARKKKEI